MHLVLSFNFFKVNLRALRLDLNSKSTLTRCFSKILIKGAEELYFKIAFVANLLLRNTAEGLLPKRYVKVQFIILQCCSFYEKLQLILDLASNIILTTRLNKI